MLTRVLYRKLPRLNDEGGFTLMEMLVAMLTGIVVTGALFAILEVSLNQTARLDDRVQADQLGRTAMTRIVDELHSTCLAPEFRPIQAKSTENELRFVDGYSKEAVIPNASVWEHRIKWVKEAGLETGTLTDYSYAPSGGSWPKYVFSESTSPTSKILIASNVAHSQTSSKTNIPIFQYFSYATTSSSSGEAPVSTLKTIALSSEPKEELEAKVAETTASVLVTFTALPNDGNTALNRGVGMSNQVTFAMSAPSSETPIEAAPCE